MEVVFLAITIYFLPSIFGFLRKIDIVALIVVLNILLGWTIVGWIILLLVACTYNSKKVNSKQNPRETKIQNIKKLFELYNNGDIDLSMEDEKGVKVFTQYAENPEMLSYTSNEIIELLNNIYLEYEKQRCSTENEGEDIAQIEKRFNERKAKRC